MATLTSTRAAAGFPVFQPIGSGVLGVAYGEYDLTAEPAAASDLAICKIPKGAVILGGWLRGGDIDTGSETNDINVGIAGNDDMLGNFGVLNGAAVTNYLPEGGFLVPLHGELATGPITVASETTILVTFVDDAATFAAGTITVVVFYVVP